MMFVISISFFFFFFNDTATTEIYTLSLHDALPISSGVACKPKIAIGRGFSNAPSLIIKGAPPDRKSTRLNSSHLVISYAVFCLKKKKKKTHFSDIRDFHSQLRQPTI